MVIVNIDTKDFMGSSRPLGLVRILRGYRARCARAPHIFTYLGTNTGIYAQIWPSLRDFCPIFGYFVALEIELFVRVHKCALPSSGVLELGIFYQTEFSNFHFTKTHDYFCCCCLV